LGPRNARIFTKGQKGNGVRPAAVLAAFLQTHLQASLQMGFEKLRSIRFANDPVSKSQPSHRAANRAADLDSKPMSGGLNPKVV